MNMLKRIARATVSELCRTGWEYALAEALIGWGFWLFFMLLGLATGAGDSIAIAGIIAPVAAGFCSWLFVMVSFSSGFQIALSLSCTRRVYAVSSLVAQMISAVAALALCYPTAWVSYAAMGLLGQGEYSAAEYGLAMYHHSGVLLLAFLLLAVLVGALNGALVLRFGQKGFWAVWLVFVLGSAFAAPFMDRIAEIAPVLLTRLSAVPPAGWYALAVAVMLGSTWLLVRRAAVR